MKWLVLLALFATQCVQEETSPPVNGWSSLDPASIPLRQRLMQYERGNLVRNPSFEQGRIINIDSNTVSYNITGWKWEGMQVYWFHDAADHSGAEVRSGDYSVKVVRSGIDETITRGHGVLSDFIRIIPGNYELSYWTRLENIQPYNERRGTKLYDAVDVRVLFYDKNMLLISGDSYHPALDLTLDQSFKAQPFAGYWTIDSLGWSQIRGRTSNDFQIEGDVPDEARYVKLFFGLKGPGTMWIDDVDFRYTGRNFTPLEKSRRYFNTTTRLHELLIPRPKQLEPRAPVAWHDPGNDSLPLPVILIPARAGSPTRAAAHLLKQTLDSLLKRHYPGDSLPVIRMLTDHEMIPSGTGRLILSIGRNTLNASYHAQLIKDLPPNPDAYRISADSLEENIIHLTGYGPTGNYYAAATLVQLFSRTDFTLHRAEILDFPDIANRGFLVNPLAATSRDQDAFLKEMEALKMNWAYLDFYRSRSLWSQPATQYRSGIRAIASATENTGILRMAQMVNPYAYFLPGTAIDSTEDLLRERWTHSDKRSRTALLDLFREGLNAGVHSLVLCAHEHLPQERPGNFGFYAASDQKAYINLQDAHLELLAQLYDWMKSTHPEASLEFVPPWYANEMIDQSRGQAEQYFNDLSRRMEREIRFLWSGPATRSYVIDAADIHRFRSLTGEQPVLMDRSLGMVPDIIQNTSIRMYPPMKLKTLSLFEPYAVHFPGPFQWAESNDKILINSEADSEIRRIRLATAADFLWNTRDYDPDLSLWCVLNSRFGKDATMELYRYNDAWFSLLGSMIAMKQDGGTPKLARQVQEERQALNASLLVLDELLQAEPAFLNELKMLKQRLEETFKLEVENISKQLSASLNTFQQ